MSFLKLNEYETEKIKYLENQISFSFERVIVETFNHNSYWEVDFFVKISLNKCECPLKILFVNLGMIMQSMY